MSDFLFDAATTVVLFFTMSAAVVGIALGRAGMFPVGPILLIPALAGLVHRQRTSLEIPRVSE